jgi:sugar phosphate isomerase/epimerase
MPLIPIGLQLFSVRDDCARDLPGTLAAVAKMGYEGVEFAGYYDRSAAELRKMLDDFGLKCCGTHIGLPEMLGNEFEPTVEFNKTLGNKYLVSPWLPEEYTNSRAAWLETAKVFSELAAKLRPHDLLCGYHNHHHEFIPVDGEMPWDTLFGNTSAEVIMQLDLGNCLTSGTDPVQFLERYPGRATTVHLKEYRGGVDKALIGEGDVRWQEVFRLCETAGKTEWYIVEQDSDKYPPLECVDRCLKALKGMGK